MPDGKRYCSRCEYRYRKGYPLVGDIARLIPDVRSGYGTENVQSIKPTPVRFRAGTEEKMAVMQERARLGLAIFADEDGPSEEELA